MNEGDDFIDDRRSEENIGTPSPRNSIKGTDRSKRSGLPKSAGSSELRKSDTENQSISASQSSINDVEGRAASEPDAFPSNRSN